MQKIDNWDDHWRQYDETLAKSPAQFYRFDQVAKEVRRIIDTSPASSLLDVGCGQGVLLQTLKKTFPSLIFGGIEYSEYGVSLTKEKMPDSQIIQGDLILNTGSLQHFSSWADIITCSEVLEHVDDPCIFLKNCLPLLKSDGRIIITVPGGPMTAFDKSIGHRQHFNHEKLNLLLKEAGYTIICNRQAGFPWHNLYRLVLL